MTTERILDYLQDAEIEESDAWFRQDYRQAFICVSLSRQGEAQAFLTSSFRIYGTHPDLVWHKIQANRRDNLAGCEKTQLRACLR